MGFVESIRTGYGKYATFQGRASRSEFWFFHLYAFLALMVASMAVMPLILLFRDNDPMIGASIALACLGLFFALGIPLISVSVRRVHDTNAAGGWVLTWYIPNIGFLVTLVWGCIPGTPGENRFGPSPLGIAAQVV
jgi:uncharacterized membrane protein YhaH (DUF805 family)